MSVLSNSCSWNEIMINERTKIPAGEIWGGVPAKFIKPVRPGQTDNAKHYVAYSKFYLEEGEEK